MFMTDKSFILSLFAVIGLILLCCPVAAADAISTIHSGNTVFIGEQGLDVSAAMDGDSIIGWWASGAAISSSSPDAIISVPNSASFSIYPTDFQTHTGTWYHLSALNKANGTAFIVVDPYLDIKIEDTTVSTDVTNKWVPTDDELQFRIDTNLVQMMQRTNVNYVPVTIKVRGPDGTLLNALMSKSGQTTALVDYQINTNPKYTGAIWGTSNRATYPTGTYSVWAECNVNTMKDNYGQAGKTISNTVTVLNQDQNPLIGNKAYVTNPTTAITTVTSRIPTTAATTVVTTTNPVTSVSTPVVTTLIETPPAATTVPVTTSVPTTHTPGFGIALVVLSLIVGLGVCLQRK